MSNFTMKARHKRTGEVHEMFAWDNYYGQHRHAYQRDIPISQLITEEEFNREYERMEEA